MKFELPTLPYAPNALEPHLSEKTIEFHYGKHHQTYVTNLNNLVTGTPFENATLETIVKEAEGAIFNNGAQIWNHTFYFTSFSPKAKKLPEGELLKAITRDFGSFDNFKTEFNKAATTLFGSGWVWLVKDTSGKLSIVQESNAGNPMRRGFTPILTCDVWEHAYYIDVKNRRADYVNSFWEILDWNIVEKRY